MSVIAGDAITTLINGLKNQSNSGMKEKEQAENLAPHRDIIIKQLNEAPQLAVHIHDVLREQVEL